MPARGERRECAGGSETFIRRAKLTLSPSPSPASKEPAQTHASLSCYQTAAVFCIVKHSMCVHTLWMCVRPNVKMLFYAVKHCHRNVISSTEADDRVRR